MKRLLIDIQLPSCKGCVYCREGDDREDYYCDNPDVEDVIRFDDALIVKIEEVCCSHCRRESPWPPIPDWCPLPDVKEKNNG